MPRGRSQLPQPIFLICGQAVCRISFKPFSPGAQHHPAVAREGGITWCKDSHRWHILHPGPCQWWPALWMWQYWGFCRTLFLQHGSSKVLACLPPVCGCCRSHLTPGQLVSELPWQPAAAAPAPTELLADWQDTLQLVAFPLLKGINAGMPEDTGTVSCLHFLESLKRLVFYLELQ